MNSIDRINKKIRLLFGFALGLSIGFPAGVLGIVFGAVLGMIPLLVLGILLTVGGFYAMPILWIKYGERRGDRALLFMIEQEHLYTVKALALQTGQKESAIREKIKSLILSHILTGYLFRDDILELNENQKQTEGSRRTKKCDHCGALMAFDGLFFRCEYCKNVSEDT